MNDNCPPHRSADDLQRGMARIRAVCDAMVSLPDEQWEGIPALVSLRRFRRGERLIEAGATPTHFFFIASGLVRCFYSTPQGREFNMEFMVEDQFVGAFSAHVLGEPCRFSIEALEATEAVVIPAEVEAQLHERHQGWERLSRLFAEQTAIRKERREAAFLLDDAERRYRDFLASHPHLEGRLPQYHIASYLGITDVALSRIKRRIAQTQQGAD